METVNNETFEEWCQRIGLVMERVQAPRITGLDRSCQVGPEPFERASR